MSAAFHEGRKSNSRSRRSKTSMTEEIVVNIRNDSRIILLDIAASTLLTNNKSKVLM